MLSLLVTFNSDFPALGSTLFYPASGDVKFFAVCYLLSKTVLSALIFCAFTYSESALLLELIVCDCDKISLL